MKKIITVFCLATLLGACSTRQEPQSRHPVTVPAGIVGATTEQQALLAAVTKLPLHATQDQVREQLGKPFTTGGNQWMYYLTEDRVHGGYYIGIAVTFESNRLDNIKIGFGHDTREPKSIE